MKSLSVEVDDTLYDASVTLLRQFPEEKVHILEEAGANPDSMRFEDAVEETLQKNSELYKRLA